jgi:hypothetical protein
VIAVYQVRPDVDHYQAFLLRDEQLAHSDMVRFDGQPKAEWTPPEVVERDPTLAGGNFWGFNALPSSIVASPATLALTEVRALLETAGQILPLPFRGELFGLLNVTELADALNHERTSWFRAAKTGHPLWIEEHAFRAERFPTSSLFKIPESKDILCHEGAMQSSGFKSSVERLGLTGLTFTEIWRSQQ